MFLQLRTKFPGMTKAQWYTQLSSVERDAIKLKCHINGPFVKVKFASQHERQRSRDSPNAHYLRGRLLKISTYTPKKQSVAPPNSPQSKLCSLPLNVLYNDAENYSSHSDGLYRLDGGTTSS
jgi:hypothetical protein